MAEKKLSPEFRFPGFENNWIVKKYEEIYSFKPTNSFSREKLNYEKGTVRNIHYGDIHTKFNSLFYITQEQVPFINEEINISRIPEECYLKVGDLVVADASENYEDIGKTIEIANLNEEKVVAGLHTFLARRKSGMMTNGFASFLMKTTSVRRQVKKIAQGTKVLGIASKRLSKISLVIPQSEEQQKIASFLTAVDQRILLLQKKKTKLEEYKKGVMQKLFSKEIRLKDENGREFPDWEEKRLGEVVTLFSGGTPSSTNKSFYSGEIPFIKSGEINLMITEQFLTEEGLNNSSAKMVDEGDLLMAIYGATSGEVAVSKLKGAINQAVICIRGEFNRDFLYNWLKFNKRFIITKYLQGGQGNLSADIIKKIRVNFPVVQEQQKIASFLSSLDQKIEQVGLQIEKTQVWKKGLLQKMFV